MGTGRNLRGTASLPAAPGLTGRDLRRRRTRTVCCRRCIVSKTKISVIVWNEYEHERQNAAVREVYPEGIHATIAQALAGTPALNPGALPLEIGTATLDQPEHGLTEARLAACDVLLWWGHRAHAKV